MADHLDTAIAYMHRALDSLQALRATMEPPATTDAHEAIVKVALTAAAANHPVNSRLQPPKWVLDDIAAAAGHRISLVAVRDALADECHRPSARLRYRRYDPHGRGGPAGWVAITD